VAVNGALGGATVTLAANGTAKAAADTINLQTSNTGVSATARTEVQAAFSAVGSYSIALTSDNTTAETISFSVSAIATANGLSNAISAINEKSSKTGVIASLNSAGTAIMLTSTTGNDIVVAESADGSMAGNITMTKFAPAVASGDLASVGSAVTVTGGATNGSVGSGISSGYVTLDSDKSFGLNATTSSATSTVADSNSTLKKVSQLDVSSVIKASDALKTVDSALSFISGERAKLGALQSRFETAISNLQVTSENLAASRSRIQDADFAAETANLSRTQILQQAGTAMVAQANQLPQNILALLR